MHTPCPSKSNAKSGRPTSRRPSRLKCYFITHLRRFISVAAFSLLVGQLAEGGEYYGYWGRDLLLQINNWVDEDVDLERLYIDRYQDERWLERLLKQFPEADEDGGGRITAEQAVRWHAKRVPLITPGEVLSNGYLMV